MKEFEILVLGDSSDPSDCLRGLVQTIVEYTAKQVSTSLDIIAKEYGHSREDLADLLRNSKDLETSLNSWAFKMPSGLKEKLGVKPLMSKSGRKVVIKKKNQEGPAPSAQN